MQIAICDTLAAGATLTFTAIEHGFTLSQLQRMRSLVPAFAKAVQVARSAAQDLRVDMIETIAREEPDVQRAKLIIDGIKFVASKLNRTYGDKLDVTITEHIQIGDTWREMAARRSEGLRLSCDLSTPLDVEYETVSSVADGQTIDTQSIEPDIFS